MLFQLIDSLIAFPPISVVDMCQDSVTSVAKDRSRPSQRFFFRSGPCFLFRFKVNARPPWLGLLTSVVRTRNLTPLAQLRVIFRHSQLFYSSSISPDRLVFQRHIQNVTFRFGQAISGWTSFLIIPVVLGGLTTLSNRNGPDVKMSLLKFTYYACPRTVWVQAFPSCLVSGTGTNDK